MTPIKQRRRPRTWCAGIALPALLTLLAFGCGPLNQQTTLTFFDGHSDTTQHSLGSELANPGDTYAWSAAEEPGFTPGDFNCGPAGCALGRALVQPHCGDGNPVPCGITARLIGGLTTAPSRQEADIFVQDLNLFRGLEETPSVCPMLASPVCGAEPCSLACLTLPGNNPPAVAIAATPFDRPAAPVSLPATLFFGSTPAGPLPVDRFGYLSVSDVRVYDHGQCSFTIGLDSPYPFVAGAPPPPAPIFPQLLQNFWVAFARTVSTSGQVAAQGPNGSYCSNDWAELALNQLTVATWLDHIPGDRYSAPGGFFLEGSFGLQVKLLHETDGIAFTADYQYRLSDGIIQIFVPLNHDPSVNVGGVVPQTVADQVQSALVNDFPQAVNATFLAAQSQDIVGQIDPGARACPACTIPAAPCDESTAPCCGNAACVAGRCGIPTEDNRANLPCKVAEEDLETLIKVGAEVSQIPAADRALLLQATGATDGSGMLKNWRCVPDAAPICGASAKQQAAAPHHCEFLVRAKRLNVYPDALELVWFDGYEPTNPAFALWIALESNIQTGMSPPPSPHVLCATPAPRPLMLRNMAWDTLTGLDSKNVECPTCTPDGKHPVMQGTPCFAPGTSSQQGLCPAVPCDTGFCPGVLDGPIGIDLMLCFGCQGTPILLP